MHNTLCPPVRVRHDVLMTCVWELIAVSQAGDCILLLAAHAKLCIGILLCNLQIFWSLGLSFG